MASKTSCITDYFYINQMIENDIQNLILAGDIYDKQIPSKEAVSLFNDFLCELILKHEFKVYIISGNHDSVERLNFASSILKKKGLYIETYANSPIAKYVINDEFGDVEESGILICIDEILADKKERHIETFKIEETALFAPVRRGISSDGYFA